MHMMTREIIPGRKTEGSTVSSINSVRNALFVSTAKLRCVQRGLRSRDVSQRKATQRGGADALKLRATLRCLPLADIPWP